MESQLMLGKWDALIENFRSSAYLIKKKEMDLCELRLSYQNVVHGKEREGVLRAIRRQEENLHRQAGRMQDLQIALEKIKRLYEGCEREIMDFCEMSIQRFPEKVEMIDLSGWEGTPVIINKKGGV